MRPGGQMRGARLFKVEIQRDEQLRKVVLVPLDGKVTNESTKPKRLIFLISTDDLKDQAGPRK
jgi:hypothetical protein